MPRHESSVISTLVLVAVVLGGAALPKPQGLSLRGNSSYISQEATNGVRSRINVQGRRFRMKAIGRNSKEGESGHHGGSIDLVEGRDSYRLDGIGIIIPKQGVIKWADEIATCERLELTDDTYAADCTSKLGEKFSYVISKARGVLSFAGHCFLTVKQVCNYVLITDKGIAAP